MKTAMRAKDAPRLSAVRLILAAKLRFDFDRDPNRMQAFSEVYDTYRVA